MRRIGTILRNVRRWLGGRLPRRIGVLLRLQKPPAPPPRTMAESREQALAAWEHLVSQHAPHLLRESPRERRGEAPLHWPRMEPFASSQHRAWPPHAAGDDTAPLQQEQRQQARDPDSRAPRARPNRVQPPDNGRGTATRDAQPERPSLPEANARPAYSPDPESASPTEHQGWQTPAGPEPQSVRARPGDWTTDSTGNRAYPPEESVPSSGPRACSPEPAIPPSGRRAHERMNTPTPDAAPSTWAYTPHAPTPPDASRKDTSAETTEPGTLPRHRRSPWLETPIPAANQAAFEPGAPEPAPTPCRGNRWPELLNDPWPSPPDGPRPQWTEADRRQRLLDEQKGVL